jgi:thioesterase domain-containing protein
VRWLTLPLARPLLALAARFRQMRLPLRFGYHLHFYFDESRRVAAVKHWYGMVNQQPLPPSIPAYLFRSQEHAPEDPEDLGWGRYFQTLSVLHQTGNHETMFDPPHLKSLCEQTRRVMHEISERTSMAESYAEEVAV